MLYAAMTREADAKDSYEVQLWRQYIAKEPNLFWKLFEHSEGRAVHTVNHLHDKPIEMNVNLSMAEIVREVRQRKEEYERSRK